MIDIIGDVLNSSIQDLFASQPDILTTTSQTTMTEWNIAHHLSINISRYLFWLDNDNDVVKRNYDNKRPDMIFHKRQKSKYNFLVVEIKKGEEISNEDVEKIKEDWFTGELNYSYGACISFGMRYRYKIIVFNNNNRTEIRRNENSNRVFSLMGRSIEEEKFRLCDKMNRSIDISLAEVAEVIKSKFS